VKIVRWVLFIFFFNQSLWAADPVIAVTDKNRAYTEAELQVLNRPDANSVCQGVDSAVSLYDPGKSLNQVKQQDQDGLGTCYANTASLIIKSYHPDKPVPSYLDLARFNPAVPNKTYEFESGYACEVVNEWQATKRPLCTDSLLENQPKEVQDKILTGLYDAINKHQASPEKVKEIFEQYQTYVAQNPKPQKTPCLDKMDQLRFENYVDFKILELVDENSFLPVREDYNYTPEEINFSKTCAKKFSERFKALGITQEESYSLDDGTISTFPIFNPAQADRAHELVRNFLKGETLPSGETYLKKILKILDSQPSSDSKISLVFDNNAGSRSYQKFVEDLLKSSQNKIFSNFLSESLDGQEELQSCLAQSPAWNEVNAESLMNTLLGQCTPVEEKQWNFEFSDEKKDCPEVEVSMFDVFNTLSDLELSMDKIEKFVLEEDKELLKQIIEKNCQNWQEYPMPPGQCERSPIPAGIVTLERPEDWKVYQQFKKDLDGYCEKFKLKNYINLNLYAEYLIPKLDAMELDKNTELNNQQMTHYRSFLNSLVKGIDSKNLSYYPLANLKQEALKEVNNLKQKQKSSGDEVVKTILAGHAVGLGTCGSLFYDDVKQKYSGCSNHSVTATGFKCDQGRLKLEVSNSWGIACADSPEQKNLFECQHDQDGLTNGRSWIDYDYLSDQGLEMSRFKKAGP
jgi:hypothetical protein